MDKAERIVSRNNEIRKKFNYYAKKHIKLEKILEKLSAIWGFHVETIRSIVNETNAVEQRAREKIRKREEAKDPNQLDLF